MQYAISEIFYSIQGEGMFTGTPMVFVRFAGCNYHCKWCDTDFSVKEKLSADELIDRVKKVCNNRLPMRVCFTGGEPTLNNLIPLMDALEENIAGVLFHIESNGYDSDKYVKTGRAYVTISPKNPDGSTVNSKTWLCDELKVVYYGQLLNKYKAFKRDGSQSNLYIQPLQENDPTKTKKNLRKAITACLQQPRWRLSLQTHKIIGVE